MLNIYLSLDKQARKQVLQHFAKGSRGYQNPVRGRGTGLTLTLVKCGQTNGLEL